MEGIIVFSFYCLCVVTHVLSRMNDECIQIFEIMIAPWKNWPSYKLEAYEAIKIERDEN